jgi:succinate dehydrogenase/fumarate reductase cytochrome b subunit
MVATAAEEARNPLRDIPIASVASVVITGAMYVLMATAIVGERLILVDTRQEEEEGGRGKGELGGGGGALWVWGTI